MDAIIQCLAHIPALTRILLEIDLCNNINKTSKLNYYIDLIKILVNPIEIEKHTRKKRQKNRNLLLLID